MRYKKFAATAMLAIAATGVAAGTSYAAPTADQPAASQNQGAVPAVTGSDQGVDYTMEMAESSNALVTTVTGGKFQLAADGESVHLAKADGTLIANVPLKATNKQGHTAEVAAQISADSNQLTLTPTTAPTSSAPSQAEFISAQQWFFAELQRASLGAGVGALIGAAVGLIFFGIGILPGAAIGALIGLAVAGGPSLGNAALAYFSGQP